MGLRLLFTYLKMNLKAAAEYRGEFLFATVMMLTTNSILYVSVLMLAARLGGIAGMSYADFLAGTAIGDIAFVVGLNFFPGIRFLQGTIINGEFDRLLVRPVSPYIHILISRINPYFVAEIITACVLLGMNPVSEYPFILFYGLMSGIIFHLSLFLYNMTPLFFNQNHETGVFDMMIGFIFYPPDMYGGVARFLALYVFPGALVSFGPIIIRYHPGFAFVYFGFVIGLIAAFALLFDLGLKRYQGAGY